MRLDEKAKESLEAVDRLLDRGENGCAEPLNNAAASRAYYAAYQAVTDKAYRDGCPMEGRGGHYRHDTLPSRALQWHILDVELCDRLTWLRDLRVKADYHHDLVDSDEAAQAAEAARAIVSTLNEEVSHESA